MNDLNPEYTDEQVLIMNQELELEELREKVATLKHEVNYVRWRERTRLSGVLGGLAKSFDEVPMFDFRKALDIAQRRNTAPFHAALFVGTEFFAWHSDELEQQMADSQANYFIYHLTAADILAYGLTLTENAQ